MEKPEQFLTETELKNLQDFVSKKNQKVYDMGSLTIQYHQEIARLNTELQKIQEEENIFSKILMGAKGFDVEKDNYQIDLSTGKITKIE